MSTAAHTERAHAPMSASRMDRIMSCPASYRLENQMPYVPAGEAAERGTRIHEIAEHFLQGNDISTLKPVSYTHLTLPTIYSV